MKEMAVADRDAELSDELRHLLDGVAATTPVVRTVGRGAPNRIIEVRSDGVMIATVRSSRSPRLVPGWMFEVAWSHLKLHGQLTSEFLQGTEGLNVKRSAAVMAVLAGIEGVRSERSPARLLLDGSDDALS